MTTTTLRQRIQLGLQQRRLDRGADRHRGIDREDREAPTALDYAPYPLQDLSGGGSPEEPGGGGIFAGSGCDAPLIGERPR
jgi:hypothetical protein